MRHCVAAALWWSVVPGAGGFVARPGSLARPGGPRSARPVVASVAGPDVLEVSAEGPPEPSVGANSAASVVAEAAAPFSSSPTGEPVSRTLRLRDSIWARQALDDLVAAEFALRLELSGESTEAASFVDFERLREQLDNRIDELDSGAGSSKIGAEDLGALRGRARDTAAALTASATAAAERAAAQAAEAAASFEAFDEDFDEAGETDAKEELKKFWSEFRSEFVRRRDAVAELSWLALRGPPKDADFTRTNMSAVLYVRQDGSVDWEGALQGAKAATAFSVDLWKRINGVADEGETADDEAQGSDGVEATGDGAPPPPPLVAESSRTRRERSLLERATTAVAATKALVGAAKG